MQLKLPVIIFLDMTNTVFKLIKLCVCVCGRDGGEASMIQTNMFVFKTQACIILHIKLDTE